MICSITVNDRGNLQIWMAQRSTLMGQRTLGPAPVGWVIQLLSDIGMLELCFGEGSGEVPEGLHLLPVVGKLTNLLID